MNSSMWACVFAFSLYASLVDGVGLKRRLEEAAAAKADRAPLTPASSSDPAHSAAQRGGVRQRLNEAASSSGSAAAATPPPGVTSPLYESLRRDWARGLLSSHKVQEYALGASQHNAWGMDELGRLGAGGKHPQNMFRELVRRFGSPPGAPYIQWVEIPTKHGKATPHPVLFPHEFFRSYWLGVRARWEQTISGGARACIEFWESMQHTDFLRFHPDLASDTWPTTVPLGLHGDGAAFSKQDNLYTFSWNSLVGTGATAQKRFLFTVVKKSDVVPGTLDAIFQVLSWSLNVLATGQTPSLDWRDRPMVAEQEPLAGGWRGVLCQVRGDWAFHKEVFNFPAWNAAERMCWMCRASSRNRRYAWNDFGPNAGWRSTRWTHAGYMAFLAASGLAIPVLLQCVRGFRLEGVMIDVLHAVDQGVASHVIGNVLWIFACKKKIFGPGTYAECVKRLMVNLEQWYKRTKCTSKIQGKFSVDRLRTKGGWPKLHAKAAATRHLAPYALRLAEEHSDGTTEGNEMKHVCRMLVRFYEILQSESQFLSDTARVEVPKLGRNLAMLYASLATKALAANERLWKLNPKLHMFVHLCEWQALTFGNPRFYWCHADEDLVGMMAEVAETCHPKTMAASALFKWLHLGFNED